MPKGMSGVSAAPRKPWPQSVAAQVFVLQLLVMLLLAVLSDVTLVYETRSQTVRGARHQALAVAAGFASSPGVAAAVNGTNPTAVLQPLAEEARRTSGVDFIAALNRHGVRYTDARPDLIGKRASGNFGRALAGESYTELFRGEPTDAVRAVVPVTGTDGTVVGIVTAGLEISTVSSTFYRQLPLLAAGAAGSLALATGAAWLVSRRLRRQTHGLGPTEVTRMYEHHDAVLHAAREGVLVIGTDGRLSLVNDEARRLLHLPADAEHRPLRDLGLPVSMVRLLTSDRSVDDAVQPVGGRLLAVNVRRTGRGGHGPAGGVATLRDTTELRSLAGRAEVAHERLELLYRASTEIGSTLDVARTAEELADLVVPQFADVVTVDLFDAVLRGDEPVPGVTSSVRRVALRGAVDAWPFHEASSSLEYGPAAQQRRAIDGEDALLVPDLTRSQDWRVPDPEGARHVLRLGFHSLLAVPLRARGVVLGLVMFWRGSQPPFQPDDVSPAEELTARAAVCIDNARRYTREHATAVSLQRSLLPPDLPRQDALEVAHHYLPARAGVGGDWFDVIPLSGARVALVVGDVVGHGLQAAATMGRLRTAVLTFSALDLPPEDLLFHLDQLVTRLDAAYRAGGEDHTVTGATLVYAVYDPTSGRCVLAGAGHPPPALVLPDGSVEFVDVPANLPLGLGSVPFQTTDIGVPPGSRLVLYTDGLVECRGRTIDAGLELLRSVLTDTEPGCESTCRTVIETMVPTGSHDDVALLVAGARRLPAEHIAQWDVPADFEAVGAVRAQCMRQLEEWGLDTGFTTELILSELITNAVRYGAPPITVRLLRHRVLICEVYDASSTAPRVIQAADFDEGGRGLFLVAQLADRWGVRYSGHGKVIWAEQSLAQDHGMTR
ncbi:SpoIIE family protein phosphatase [Streptomyces sp. MH60]|uniref:SpoIIE family protein phosphatase n=1 Tax=Streptomyces sp. MH60 TaxID=1940758 RepID=UPI000D4F65B7|nr:SpoIIE family protein phosphatase [Streptomyces sp. MH60]PPS89713.1 Sensor histidine kinase DcuS [Streptomyces sp. MH60]